MKTANILTAIAFANPAPVAAAETKKAGAPKIEDRIAPQFGAISAAIKPPVSAKRGAVSPIAIELEKLEVGHSLPLLNKTKKQISSTISKISNAESNQRQKVDANGNKLFKQGEPIKDANGAIVGNAPGAPDMERIKEYEAHDVEAKKDEAKAICRIWRIK